MRNSLLYFLLFPFVLMAQNHTSIIEEQSNYYKSFNFIKQAQWDSLSNALNGTINNKQKKTSNLATSSAIKQKAINNQALSVSAANKQTTNSVCTLTKKVYGWHPYWMSSTIHNNYDWSLLSELCYFDYAVSPTTGNNTNTSFAWNTSPAITAAISNSVNVHFCATMFSSHSTFLASSTAQQTFITNAINLLNSRGGKGLNIDFEGMVAGNKTAFKNFMVDLCNQVHAANPGYKVTVALPAVEWSSTFDIPVLKNYIDDFIIMGYDYYYGGSSQAGPTAPLYNFSTSYNYTLSKSVTYYLNAGVPINKLLLGLPWYGREWETVAATIPSNTTGNFNSSRTFAYVKNNPSIYATKKWDNNSFSPYYTYVSGGNNRQCFIDDYYSLTRKLDLVNQRGLAGIGIWALGQDDGHQDYWNAIKNKLSTCAVVPCNDSIYDMGGPNRNHYDKESYVYTIAPSSLNKVRLTFSQFDLETGFDSLYLFDGPTITSPLLGAYTGTISPGIVNATGSSITVKFKSNNANNKAGFRAKWNCISDAVSPTTQVNTPSGFITQNFTTNYTDIDNLGGSGINKSFYQPSYFNGTEWRANVSRGFFNDDFNTTTLHADWTIVAGNWGVTSGALTQSDETNANTNLYTNIDQTLSNRYLYHFKGTITGTNTNRRAGIHIMCDNATQTNRGSNYLILFRPDQSNVEMYEVTTNTLSLVKTTPYTFTIGTTYDYKITYDRTSGELALWINTVFVTSWIDTTPLTTGNAISLRAANCNFKIDDFKIFRSRASSNTILVGGANTNDLRNENVAPTTPSGKISSIVNDNANNISTIDAQLVDVDWTKPIASSWIKDGVANDLDTTNNGAQLNFNFSAAKDTNSNISTYYYAIGTTAGLQDVTPWTSNGTALTASNLVTLTDNQKYYIMLKAMNGAGLMSDSIITDGILYLSAIGIEEGFGTLSGVDVYPNPAAQLVNITVISSIQEKINYTLTDALGKELINQQTQIHLGLNAIHINTSTLVKGVYFLNLFSNKKIVTKKIVIEY